MLKLSLDPIFSYLFDMSAYTFIVLTSFLILFVRLHVYAGILDPTVNEKG